MKVELNKAMRATEYLQEYDNNIKFLLSQKIVLAHILAGTVREFIHMKPEEIIPYIEGEPEVGTVFLEPGLTNVSSKIQGNNTVDVVPNEGFVTFDVRFNVRYPKNTANDTSGGIKKELIKLLVDVEAQKDFYPGYDIVTRGVYYAARQISAQKGTEFEHSDYDNIKKVYSIWICLYPPKYCENSIMKYQIQEKITYGAAEKGKFRYDLMEIVLINLPREIKIETTPTLNGMLKILFSPKLSKKEIQDKLEHEYHIPMTGKIKGGISTMCNFSEAIFEEAMERGLQQGIERGLQQGIEQGIEQGIKQGIQRERIEGIRNVMQIVLDLGGDIQAAVAKAAERYHEDEKRIWDIWEKREKQDKLIK